MNSEELRAFEYAQNMPSKIAGTRYLIYRDIPEFIKEYVSGKLTLDYGCGTGKSTLLLKSLGLDVEGVDINQHMIDIAKGNDPTGKYQVIKSGETPMDDDTYDLITAVGVFSDVKSKEELFKICKEIARVLKVGGTFIYIGNNDETYNHEWLSIGTSFDENRHLESGSLVKYLMKDTNYLMDLYYWSESDYCEAFSKAGMKVLQIHKPLGSISDGNNWINEHKIPYCALIVCEKL